MDGLCAKGGFLLQFSSLAWKNYLVKRRAFVGLILELCIPVIIILALGALSTLIKATTIKPIFPNSLNYTTSSFHGQYTDNWLSGSLINNNNLVWSCASTRSGGKYKPLKTKDVYDPIANATVSQFDGEASKCRTRHIAVTPDVSTNVAGANAASQFVHWAETMYSDAAKYKTFRMFPSEDETVAKLTSGSYVFDQELGIYSAVIVFKSGAPTWDYTIRFNQTAGLNRWAGDNPSTKTPVEDISCKSANDCSFMSGYVNSGYFALTDVINSFVLTSTCASTPHCQAANITLNTLGGIDMPTPEYTSNGFWGAIGQYFGLLMIISVLYPLSNVISELVKEKEVKLREGMMMMSLQPNALWASWGFHFLILFFCLSILLTAAGGGALFKYSQSGLIFSYFFVFFMASVAFCIFMSQIFSKARPASIIGTLLFLGGYFIYVGIESGGATLTRNQILLASLHPACAFTFGTLAFSEYEDAQVGVTFNTWNVSKTYPVTFQDTLNMMFIDFFWLLILSWYCGHVWPSEFGTQRPWYFPFTSKYWKMVLQNWVCFKMRPASNPQYDRVSPTHVDPFDTVTLGVPVEKVTENLAAQIDQKKCVDIRNLHKSFITNTGVKKAVDGLYLTMFQGQITALLGHNGAGKTTLISMLTGLIPPDEDSDGHAEIEGLNIHNDMDEIRRNLGVCPQHDILFPTLTVEEHLLLFASFKGTPRKQQKEEVEKMIQAVGLTEKRHVYSKFLSGGQKRKLSVGIAFIGGSRIVFLDEPTSGMDPYSRRFTWNIIRQHKEGRVVVLTTHFMDEADLLGDRVAIMGDGKLRCCGSSLFLKKEFGVGYNMTIEKRNATSFDTNGMVGVITSRVPDATVLTDVGTELTLQLPFSSSTAFQNLFEFMDNNQEKLGYHSYGMSVTTLEEVFIKVAHGTSTQSAQDKAKNVSKEGSVNAYLGGAAVEAVPIESKAMDLESQSTPHQMLKFDKVNPDNLPLMFMYHVKAMMYKRMLYFMRDTRSWIYQYVVPVVFVLIGMLILRFRNDSSYQPPLTFDTAVYNTQITTNILPVPYNSAPFICAVSQYNQEGGLKCSNITSSPAPIYPGLTQKSIMESALKASNLPLVPMGDDVNSISEISEFMYAHRNDHAASVYGGITIVDLRIQNMTTFNYPSMSSWSDLAFFALLTLPENTLTLMYQRTTSISYAIHANITAVHAGPVYGALFADAVAKTINPSTSIKISYFPLPKTDQEIQAQSNYNIQVVVDFIMLAISFIPAAFSTYIVREREVKAKHQQFVSGVSIPAYWISTFLFDIISYQPTVWMIIILIAAFPNTKLLSGLKHHQLAAVIGLFQLFGTSITGFSYIVSIFFNSPSTAQIATIFLVLILGFILSIVGFVLRILSDTRDLYNKTLRYIFALFPPCAFGDGLRNMASIDIWSSFENRGSNPYTVHNWRIAGMGLTFLAWESFAFMAIVIAWEYYNYSSLSNAFAPKPPPTDSSLKDEDVIEEERRVLAGEADSSSTILVKDMKKMYPGGKFAVRGISLGIPNGECFGLLGINGAGKSTTLSMLSGEFLPSSGEASLAGHSLINEIHACRRRIGFCPQFDALFELLTGREHLELYARIKGIAEKDIKAQVEAKINEMGLVEYADRAAGTYSGGNKRKLSVAVAMIGEPSIVFLDEPSTGMDPVARRFMWEVISDIVTKRGKCSLILTTHSMEECEALCTRIGIMVGGVLRCLGSAQRLRSRYGNGYQIEVSLVIPDADAIAAKAAEIMSILKKGPSSSSASASAANSAPGAGMNPLGPGHDEVMLTKSEMFSAFARLGKNHWVEQISHDGTGNDLQASLDANNWVSCRHLASWSILEESYDGLCEFLTRTFGSYVLRERQTSKVRVEITAVDPSSPTGRRRLSTMFGSIEAKKDALRIQEYSVSQTSLEQIFNFFAGQQLEETGGGLGIKKAEAKVQAPAGGGGGAKVSPVESIGAGSAVQVPVATPL